MFRLGRKQSDTLQWFRNLPCKANCIQKTNWILLELKVSRCLWPKYLTSIDLLGRSFTISVLGNSLRHLLRYSSLEFFGRKNSSTKLTGGRPSISLNSNYFYFHWNCYVKRVVIGKMFLFWVKTRIPNGIEIFRGYLWHKRSKRMGMECTPGREMRQRTYFISKLLASFQKLDISISIIPLCLTIC